MQSIGEVKAVAGEAEQYELHLRLLAIRVNELRDMVYVPHLKNLELGVVAHFIAMLSDADIDTLEQSRQLRNLLLHDDPYATNSIYLAFLDRLGDEGQYDSGEA